MNYVRGVSHMVPLAARRSLASKLPRSPWLQAVCVAVLGALALAVLSELSRRELLPRGDDEIYERMAQHPLGTHTFPFAYRIGLPWLVHALPFAHTFCFRLLAALAAGGAGGFAFLLMRHFKTPGGLALGLALALVLSPPMLIVALRDGRNTDAMTMLFMMAATLFVVRRKPAALTIALLLGVLVREAELFIIPLAYAVWTERALDLRVMRRVALVGAPAMLAYVALHLAIPSVGKVNVPGYGGSLIGERFSVIKSGLDTLFPEARRLFSVYGPLWVAAPLALAGSRFARRGLVLVACSLVSMTFALDWGRMLFLAAPAFYPAAAYTLTRHPRWRAPALVAFGVLILGYAVYMDRSGVRSGIIENAPPPYPVR